MSNEKKKGTKLLYSLIAEANSYPDTIVLGRGDPDFDTPAHIVAAAQEAMRTHANDYAPPEGLLALRQAIAERVKRVNNIEVDPESVVEVRDALLRLLGDTELRTRLALQGRRRVHEMFSLERGRAAFAEVMDELAGSHN